MDNDLKSCEGFCLFKRTEYRKIVIFFFGRNAVKNEIDLYILFEQSWVGIENINDDYYNGESIWKNDNSTRLGI